MSRRLNDRDRSQNDYSGVSRNTGNTLGGPFNENRGPRYDNDDRRDLSFGQTRERGYRNHGGSQIGHDIGHSGRGPRGYKRSDDSIYHDVCDTLTMSPDIDASEIEVSVKDGVVFLNGSVPDRETKKLAELDIENISGISDVQNLLNFGQNNEELH